MHRRHSPDLPRRHRHLLALPAHKPRRPLRRHLPDRGPGRGGRPGGLASWKQCCGAYEEGDGVGDGVCGVLRGKRGWAGDLWRESRPAVPGWVCGELCVSLWRGGDCGGDGGVAVEGECEEGEGGGDGGAEGGACY